MPTGIGKTEAMLPVVVSVGCPKLLVVVPTDSLRTQLAVKCLTLEILKSAGCGVLFLSAKPHIVCSLVHISHTVTEVDDVFIRAQAILRRAALRDAASQLSRSAVTGFYKIPDPIQTATGGDFHSA